MLLFGMGSVLDKLFNSVMFVGVDNVGNESFAGEDIAYFQFELMGKSLGKLFEDIQRDAIDIDRIGNVGEP